MNYSKKKRYYLTLLKKIELKSKPDPKYLHILLQKCQITNLREKRLKRMKRIHCNKMV